MKTSGGLTISARGAFGCPAGQIAGRRTGLSVGKFESAGAEPVFAKLLSKKGSSAGGVWPKSGRLEAGLAPAEAGEGADGGEEDDRRAYIDGAALFAEPPGYGPVDIGNAAAAGIGIDAEISPGLTAGRITEPPLTPGLPPASGAGPENGAPAAAGAPMEAYLAEVPGNAAESSGTGAGMQGRRETAAPQKRDMTDGPSPFSAAGRAKPPAAEVEAAIKARLLEEGREEELGPAENGRESPYLKRPDVMGRDEAPSAAGAAEEPPISEGGSQVRKSTGADPKSQEPQANGPVAGGKALVAETMTSGQGAEDRAAGAAGGENALDGVSSGPEELYAGAKPARYDGYGGIEKAPAGAGDGGAFLDLAEAIGKTPPESGGGEGKARMQAANAYQARESAAGYEPENEPDEAAEGPASFAAGGRADIGGDVPSAEEGIEKRAAVEKALNRFAEDFRGAEAGRGEIRLTLEPEKFGAITISVAKAESGLSARIKTEDKELCALISNRIQKLIDAMESRGLDLRDVEVVFGGTDGGLAQGGHPDGGGYKPGGSYFYRSAPPEGAARGGFFEQWQKSAGADAYAAENAYMGVAGEADHTMEYRV